MAESGGGLANVALATDGADLAFDRLQGGRPRSRCAPVLRPRRRDRRQDREGGVPHRAHPQDQHAGGRLLRLRAPDAAVCLSQRMGEASQRRARIAGVTVIAEQPARWTAELEKYFVRRRLGDARRRGHRRRHRHTADPLSDAPSLPRTISRQSRRCGRATIRRCSASGSTAWRPAAALLAKNGVKAVPARRDTSARSTRGSRTPHIEFVQ